MRTFRLANTAPAGEMRRRRSRVIMTSRVVWAAVAEQIKAETVRSITSLRIRARGHNDRPAPIIRSLGYMAKAETFGKQNTAGGSVSPLVRSDTGM